MKYADRFRSLAILLCLSATVCTTQSQAQNSVFWTDAIEATIIQKATRQVVPDRYRVVELALPDLQSHLALAPQGTAFSARSSSFLIDLPTPDGGFSTFSVVEASIMHPDLQASFPDLRTYAGQGIEDPQLTVRFDLTSKGFHAMVLGHENGAWFIDPYSKTSVNHYVVYAKRDYNKQLSPGFVGCHYQDVNTPGELNPAKMIGGLKSQEVLRVGDCQLRTYQLALACTGEYANFHGSNTTNNDKTGAMGAMLTTMNRVNGIYEREATLTMVIVPGNDALIFLDSATDPYSNGSGGAMLGENQTTCDNAIGSANYDIGHVFSTGGGGVAYLRSPCGGSKAGGVTGQANPINDPFDVDYVAHEMGHQFGGNHTQNNNCNRSSAAAREPGSASSIMGYAGICAPNVQGNSDATFHSYSMQEIHTFITGSGNSCATVTPSGNTAPVANAGADHTIPASTPFVLEGTGTDADAGTTLTYKWDQMDNQVSTQPPSETSASGPNFRSYVPQTSPDRYLPRLSDLVVGTDYDWEELSTVSRPFNFRLTVLDNASGAGCNDQDDMLVTVDGSTGPFVVTVPNTNITWSGNNQESVTWNVAGSDGGSVNAANVDIFLSVDGGFTYPHLLLANTPNDGSQLVPVPDIPNTTSRIMVRGSGNIFFDISDVDFTIIQGSPDFSVDVSNNALQACQPADATTTVQIGSALGFSDPVQLATASLPAGLTATFNPSTVTPAGSSSLTISGTGGVAMGSYSFDVLATSTTGSKTVTVTLAVGGQPATTTLNSPADAATGVAPGTAVTWSAAAGASSYEVELATDAGFANIVETGAPTGTSYAPATATTPSTTYYWRVKGQSACAEGAYSSTWSFTTGTCNTLTVSPVLDRYGSETTWELTDGTTSYASGGPYTDEASSGEYPQSDVVVCVPDGCYSLIVNDTFGDGLCCAFGNGEISVKNTAGTVLASASSFATTTTIEFYSGAASCIDATAYSENFDVAGCYTQWNNVQGDDFDWTLNSGDTPSDNTGPTSDHTGAGGNYYYTETSNPVALGDVAILESSCLDLQGAVSLEVSFWYHMYGADMGTLSLQGNEGGNWVDFWTLSGDQTDQWSQATVSIPVSGNLQQLRFRGEVGATGSNFLNDMAIDDIAMTLTTGFSMASKVFLEGPYDAGTNTMSADLSAAGLVPLDEPFTALGFAQVGDGGGEVTTAAVLAATGADAIVDWVLLELRSAGDNAVVVSTRSALLQSDGDIVDVDGTSGVFFELTAAPMFVAVRHRNHLGCMTAATVDLAASPIVDFTDPITALYGTEAQKLVGTAHALWAGNTISDGILLYTGAGNDRDPVLVAVGGAIPTATATGYLPEDITLDGVVKYTGQNNDREPILVNIGGSIPTSSRLEQLP